MTNWLDPQKWRAMAEATLDWAMANVFAWQAVAQIALIIFVYLLAQLASRPARAGLESLRPHGAWGRWTAETAAPLSLPAIAAVLLWVAFTIGEAAGFADYALRVAVSLLTAWVIIRLIASLVRNRLLSRTVATGAWTIAALNIMGWLEPTAIYLDNARFSIGDAHLSLLSILMGALTFVVLIWLAQALSGLVEHRLRQLPNLTPSTQVLFSKLTRIALITLAIVIGLNSAGLDLTAFAVFSGAIGVGIGFGLQRVVSNLISGVILLMDRSIKPGDVIEIQGAYGTINSLAARYTSVITRDGTEYLVPNEDMITQTVINWSHSNRRVRRRIAVGISYGSDVRQAMALMVEAARQTARVLSFPEPRALLRGFGDSAVDLELRLWIDDPQNGVSNVASEVLLAIWDKFHDAGIAFPYPQRDLHIVSAPGLAPISGDK